MKIEVTDDTSLETENSEILDLENEVKKKSRKKRATICTAYCKFDIVRKTAKILGMKDVGYDEGWNVLWTDYSVSVAKIKVLKGYQRVNHFPGMAEICHKALLAKNLNRMAKSFPKQYDFFPKTWCFPTEYKDAVDYSKKHVGRTYILKPGAGCRGQGIQLTKNFRSLPPADKLICQLYISKPFLVDGLKFDLRVYTLITSCNPLRIFVYNDGLARFATAPYRKPAGYNLANCYMHLTNYSVNKYSSTFVSDGECGTKRRLSCLNQWLSRNLYDVDSIWSKIDDVIVKTIISALPVIKHSYHVSFPNHSVMPACFEILGFDILLDTNLNPYVLEVNHSPSFNCDSKVDEEIKLSLLEDTFKLLNLAEMNTQKFIKYEKRITNRRLTSSSSDLQDSDEAQNNTWNWKEGDAGNYRLVYPVNGTAPGTKDDPYRTFIEGAGCINYTVAENITSNIRGTVNKIQRDQLSEKDQLQHLLKVHSNKLQHHLYKPPEINLKDKTEKTKFKMDNLEPEKKEKHEQVKVKTLADKKPEDTENETKNNQFFANSKIIIPDEKPDDELTRKTDEINPNYTHIKHEKTEKKISDKKEIKENDCLQEKKNSNVNRMDSSINLVILTSEEQKKADFENKQGSDYFVNKLYNRLKESGHMPGAVTDIVTPDKPKEKENSPEEHSTLKRKSHKPSHRHRKHKLLKDPEMMQISDAVFDKTPDSITEYTVRFHSRAASEFLKFQKMKLLKKFKDLT